MFEMTVRKIIAYLEKNKQTPQPHLLKQIINGLNVISKHAQLDNPDYEYLNLRWQQLHSSISSALKTINKNKELKELLVSCLSDLSKINFKINFLPAEIIEHTAHFLQDRDLAVLSQTCTFFALSLKDMRLKRRLTQTIKQVICGYSSSFVIMEDGSVYSFGKCSTNDLGSFKSLGSTPVKINAISNICHIATVQLPLGHTLFLREDGRVFVCGLNTEGELGLEINISDNKEVNKHVLPSKVKENSYELTYPLLHPNLSDIKQVAAGSGYSLFLTRNGRVLFSGKNPGGWITRKAGSLISELPNCFNICQVASGTTHALLLSSDGIVFTFGDNTYGQLGIGTFIAQPVPTPLFGLPKIVMVAAGPCFSLLLSETGELYSFGLNNSGQLGLSDTSNRNIPTLVKDIKGITAIYAGGFNRCFVRTTSSIYACGSNTHGQLSIQSTDCVKAFKEIEISKDDIIDISVGSWHTLFLNAKNQLLGYGLNADGQLGPCSDSVHCFSLCLKTLNEEEDKQERRSSCSIS